MAIPSRSEEDEPSAAFLEVARKLNPRRKLGAHPAKSYDEACRWSQTLDWQNNPYDRFLLRRELLLYFERLMHEDPRKSIFRLASKDDINEAIDWLFAKYEKNCKEMAQEFMDVAGIDYRTAISIFSFMKTSLPSFLQHVYARPRRR